MSGKTIIYGARIQPADGTFDKYFLKHLDDTFIQDFGTEQFEKATELKKISFFFNERGCDEAFYPILDENKIKRPKEPISSFSSGYEGDSALYLAAAHGECKLDVDDILNAPAECVESIKDIAKLLNGTETKLAIYVACDCDGNEEDFEEDKQGIIKSAHKSKFDEDEGGVGIILTNLELVSDLHPCTCEDDMSECSGDCDNCKT